MKKLINILVVLAVFAGVIDMPATLTPYANSYASRNGYVMPGYMDYVVGVWEVPCKDLYVLTGTGSAYSNNISIVFYNGGDLVSTQTVSFSPWSEIVIFTSFEYDTVVFVNPDNATDSVLAAWGWWHYSAKRR